MKHELLHATSTNSFLNYFLLYNHNYCEINKLLYLNILLSMVVTEAITKPLTSSTTSTEEVDVSAGRRTVSVKEK